MRLMALKPSISFVRCNCLPTRLSCMLSSRCKGGPLTLFLNCLIVFRESCADAVKQHKGERVMQSDEYQLELGWQGDGGLGIHLIHQVLERKKTATCGPKSEFS